MNAINKHDNATGEVTPDDYTKEMLGTPTCRTTTKTLNTLDQGGLPFLFSELTSFMEYSQLT